MSRSRSSGVYSTGTQRDSIEKLVANTSYYDLKTSAYRFYIVDLFAATDARKTSKDGIWGYRYVDIEELIPNHSPTGDYSTQEFAVAIQAATWT